MKNPKKPPKNPVFPTLTIDEDDDDEAEGKLKEEYAVVIEFGEEDGDILKCPTDLNEAIVAAGVEPGTPSDVQVNINRNILVLKTHMKLEAEKWINIKTIGGKNVTCRWAKQTSLSSFGGIGPIQCPSLKEEMERKKLQYINAFKDCGADVIGLE